MPIRLEHRCFYPIDRAQLSTVIRFGRAGQNRAANAALSDMRAEFAMTLSDPTRLALTEAALASADRLWREELRRTYGPDGVLIYGYAPEGQGGLGTSLRRSYEARRVAVALWRNERRRAS